MEKVARMNAQERDELFTETAARIGTTPAVVEKDFWDCCENSSRYQETDERSLHLRYPARSKQHFHTLPSVISRHLSETQREIGNWAILSMISKNLNQE